MDIVLSVINVFLSVLEYSVIIECLCSWIPQTKGSKALSFFQKINGPFVNPIRWIINKIIPDSPLDFSPLVLIAVIGVIRYIL